MLIAAFVLSLVSIGISLDTIRVAYRLTHPKRPRQKAS